MKYNLNQDLLYDTVKEAEWKLVADNLIQAKSKHDILNYFEIERFENCYRVYFYEDDVCLYIFNVNSNTKIFNLIEQIFYDFNKNFVDNFLINF